MEQLLIIKLILQLREVLRIMWLLLEHFLEETDFDLFADCLWFQRFYIKFRVFVENFQVVSQGLFLVRVVELWVIASPVRWINYFLLLVPVFAERKLLVQAEITLENFDFVPHLDLVAIVDDRHLLSVLFGHFFVEKLLRVFLFVVFLALLVVQIWSPRVEINVRKLI